MALTISGLASTAGVLPGSAAPALAVPGTPGTPQTPTVVFDEDFDNRPGLTPIARLTEYVGATGQTYTAAPGWLTGCNGWVAASGQPVNAGAQVADCVNQSSWNSAQQLAGVLGTYGGDANPASNFAVSAYTSNSPGANQVEFATATNITLPAATGRYLTFSVDVAAVNCPPIAAAPGLDFSLLDGAGTALPVGDTINPCVTGQSLQAPALGVAPARPANVGTYTSNGSVLLDGASFGIQMTNATGTGGGNDHAFDNIRVLDVTPQLDKSFSDASIVRGETTTLTFTVTNTSELASKAGWSFTDVLPEGMTVAGAAATTCPAGVVDAQPGGSEIAVTGNLNAGQAACTITVDVTTDSTGTFVNGPGNVTETGLNPPGETTVVVEEQAPELTLEKSSDAGLGEIVVGQVVTYSFLVTNTGNIRVDDVSITDEAFTGSGELGPITCPAEVASLEVDASVTCTAEYTITQDDVDAGEVDNTATASGTPPAGEETTSNESSTTVPAPPAPELTIVKSADVEGPVNLGDEIVYSFEVANSGNVTIDGVAVDDDRLAAAGITVTCEPTTLAPLDTATCVADEPYTVTEADLLAGDVENTATATGTDPDGEPTESTPDTITTPTAAVAPALTIQKSADTEGPLDLGDEIVYAFVVSNAGNVTIDTIAVDDDRLTAAGIAVTCEATTLTPQTSTTCVADEAYTVTEADLLAGDVENTATTTGTDPTGTPIESTPSTITTPTAEVAPGLSIDKSADVEGSVDLGDAIVYTFVVSNTGNVTIDAIAVDDDRLAAAGIAVTCDATTLAPQTSTTCVSDPYTVTEADVLAGDVENTATAGGTDPNGDPTESTPDTITTPTVDPAPALVIDKSAEHDDADGNGAIDLGEEILYSFAVTNTGNLTVDGVTIDDPLLAAAGIAVTCDPATVAPGITILCVADAPYVVTQTDVDAGQVVNVATAGGTPNGGGDPIESPTDTTTTPGETLPGMTSSKSAELDDANGNGTADAGESITFTVTVTNTGNVTLTDIVVTDPMVAVTCPQPVLAPGASMDCVSTPYTVTAADVTRGEVLNTASVTGSTPGGDEISSTTNTTRTPATPIAAAPAPAPSLPQTGAEVASAMLVLMAMLLLAAGGVLVARRRVG